MKKRWIAIPLILLLIAGAVWSGFAYFDFVTGTIFAESTAHLTEIFHQANQTLSNLVIVNWSQMRMWAPYLAAANSEEDIRRYVNLAREESNFTDFFFISRNGEYITLEGKRGYLDLREKLAALILEDQPVVANSVVPDQPEIMVFAIPTDSGVYGGFDYEAIAITFNNSDLVEALKISAFGGYASTFAVLPDGRVVVNNASQELRGIHNILALLERSGSLDAGEIAGLKQSFLAGSSGALVFSLLNQAYYMVYEPAGFQNWTVLGIVPADVVNASMSKLQAMTMLVVSGIAIALAVLALLFVIQQSRLKLRKKDTELLARDELFSKLSLNVDDVFLMMNAKDLRVNYVSPNVEKLLGIPQEQIREDIHAIERIVMGNETSLMLERLSDLKPGQQKEWDREYAHGESGEMRWFRVIAFCSDIQGEKKYILDLSDRTRDKKTNLALEAAAQEAQRANHAKSTFLSNMSHDIRTPMNAVIGFTTLAKANIGNREKLVDYLDKILSSGNHLLSLINDVLDMSRIESGKIHLEEAEHSLAELFHDLKNIIIGQIHAKRMELRMEVRGVLDEDVYCDKTRVNQVMLNLISNAVKFTPEGGSILVSIEQLPGAPQGRGRYEIRVRDNGIGMTPEFAERIFEPFERERTSTVSRIQGTGLGMAICKGIIDMMGGSIEVRTQKDRGTEFVIRIELRLQSGRRGDAPAELKGLRVLVAAEDDAGGEGLCAMLRALGMNAEWALSGEDALLRAQAASAGKNPFGVCILEGHAPGADAGELARQLRATGQAAPRILVSADSRAEQESEAQNRAPGDGVVCCAQPVFLSDWKRALLTSVGEAQQEDGALPAAAEGISWQGKRLLLVEDNELNREIALEILSGYGFVMDVAENGAIAVEKVSACAPRVYDLILMDIQMPVMDGYAATRAIRSLEKQELARIPILAMTANAFNEDRRAALESGMDGFLSKPIDIAELMRTLQEMLRREG